MSKIFELFGYPLHNWTKEAGDNRALARCPFMDAECDGGGNRYLSGIDLSKNKELKRFFPKKKTIQSGVCSLRPSDGEQPWIVCPRRMLALRQNGAKHQQATLERLLKISGLGNSVKLGVWSEVKIKTRTANQDEEEKIFDYTFDYVVAGKCRKKISEIAAVLEKPEAFVKKQAEANSFTCTRRDGEYWVDDFPAEPFVIVEVMTSSTSGGNKEKRTQIAMAFEDAVKNGMNHEGPGINYRQVWARMVSQLIVKSQVAIAWGGKTVWLVQDVLAGYISQTTALNLEKFIAEHSDEVNILSFGYGEKSIPENIDGTIVELAESKFYAGPISSAKDKDAGFLDIVKIGAAPPKETLLRSLFLKKPIATIPK